jgi:hypothetical protein
LKVKRLLDSFEVPSQPTGSAGPESSLSPSPIHPFFLDLTCSHAIYSQFTPGALFSHGDCAILSGMMTKWRASLASRVKANQSITLLKQPANLSVHYISWRLRTSSRTLELIDGQPES